MQKLEQFLVLVLPKLVPYKIALCHHHVVRNELTDSLIHSLTHRPTHQLYACSRFLTEQLAVLSQSRNVRHFMEPECSLPYSQQPACCVACTSTISLTMLNAVYRGIFIFFVSQYSSVSVVTTNSGWPYECRSDCRLNEVHNEKPSKIARCTGTLHRFYIL